MIYATRLSRSTLATSIAASLVMVVVACGGDVGTGPDGVGGDPVEIAFSVAPRNTSVGLPFEGLAVEVRDAGGNVVEDFTDQVTISIGENPLGGSLTGQFGRDAANGVASFPGLALDQAGAGYTLEASAGDLSVESGTFNVTRPSLYVGHGFAGTTITVIDPTTNTELTTVDVGSRPQGVDISPDGLFAYVASRTDGTVSVIETPGNTVVETIDVGSSPRTVRVSPDGSTVVVANHGDGDVSVIDTGSRSVIATIDVGTFPDGMAFTPDGARVYVANFSGGDGDGTVSVIDTGTNTVAETIQTGSSPLAVEVTPDGSHVYVTGDASHVSIISTSSNTVVGTISVGGLLRWPAFTSDGSTLFVPDAFGGTIARIDTATNTVTETIDISGSPLETAVSPDDRFLYVGSSGATGEVVVIEIATSMVVETILVNDFPRALAFMPAPIP